MIFYFDFEGRKLHAQVYWPDKGTTIQVALTDSLLIRQFPSDLIYELKSGNRIAYTIESRENKRLCELQRSIGKRLQEFANQM